MIFEKIGCCLREENIRESVAPWVLFTCFFIVTRFEDESMILDLRFSIIDSAPIFAGVIDVRNLEGHR